jgi:PAS domain S-box-containing protein
MNKLHFSQQVEAAQERLALLEQQVKAVEGASASNLQAETLAELAVALAELGVVEEELRHQNEELLAAQYTVDLERQRYQDLFDFAPDGYLVTDPQGVIREANRVASLMLQVPPGFLVGKPLLIFVAPDDRRTLSTELRGLQTESKFQNWELRLKPREGPLFDAAISVAAKRNPEGRLINLRWLLHDITTRKRSEQNLQESEAFSRAILNSLAAHIAVLDEDGVIVSVNSAWGRFAYENGGSAQARTGLGMNYLEVCRQAKGESADEAYRALAGIEGILNGSRPHFNLEYSCHSPTERRWFLLNATPLLQTGYGAVVAHHNITEQKRIEQEKAQLFVAISQQREQLRALAARLAEVQEVERKQLSRELHDRVGRNLTALGLNLNIVRSRLGEIAFENGPIQARLDDSLALVEQTTEYIRDVMANLRPPVLDDYGLVAALEWYGTQLASRVSFSITVQGEEPAPRLAPPLENALFRIVQEALTNTVKHAQASQVRVTLATDNQVVRLVVADDGIGFEPDVQTELGGRPSWGLLNMAERAEAVGGRCWVESTLGQGTRVIAQAPRAVAEPNRF